MEENRINGTNSDYRYYSKYRGVQSVYKEEKIWPDPLELKLFICPTAQKTSLQTDKPAEMCTGINTVCPTKSTGHALLQLHQRDGIRLRTDNNNHIQLDQNGNIKLSPTASGKIVAVGNVEVEDNAGNLRLNIAQDTVQLAGRIELKYGTTSLILENDSVVVKVNNHSLEIKSNGEVKISSGGGSILMDANGITLTPAANTKVKVDGNLQVSGTINGRTFP
jgi:hypothetical protein